MFHEKIKALFSSAVDSVASTISKYSVHPDKDFTRQKKLPPDKLITFLVSQGSSSTSEELWSFLIWMQMPLPFPHSISNGQS